MSAPCTGVSAVVTSSDPNRAPANVDIVVILLVFMTKSLPLAAVGGRGDPIGRKRSLRPLSPQHHSACPARSAVLSYRALSLFSDECRDDVIGHCLDLASGQRRRMRIARRIGTQILPTEAIAVRVLIGVFVEVRHFGSRPTAGDHLDQLLAVKARLLQIGRPAGRTRITTPVTIDAMAKLAVRLVTEQGLAERHVLR